ncbi:MAG: hypothetical protein WCA49_21290 [Candidatus Sulfotelmatobacter sp.]
MQSAYFNIFQRRTFCQGSMLLFFDVTLGTMKNSNLWIKTLRFMLR